MILKRHTIASAQKTGYARPRTVFLLDLLLSMLASLLAILAVRWLSEPMPGFTTIVLIWVGLAIAATSVALLATRSYRDVRKYATLRSTGKNIGMVVIKEAILALALVLGFIHLPEKSLYWLLVLGDAFLTIGLILGIRVMARSYLLPETPKIVMEKAARRTALVHGIGDDSLALARKLEQEGFEVLGLLVQSNPAMSGRVIADYVVYSISSEKDLSNLQWRLGGVDCVWFPQGQPDPMDPSEIPTEDVVQADGMSFAGHVVKRGFDVALSAALLLVFSPLIGLFAWLVKREDGGPAIYKQERMGRAGMPFTIYKFRTMSLDAEASGSPALYTGEDDPRLTRIGHFLRTHHLDELPQLYNVLRGDMSFIGPRPERSYYIGQIIQRNPRYRYLFQIRPGVTSYATLYNGYTDSLEKMLTRLDLDLYYLRNHTLWFDAKVLWLTFLSIIIGKKF